MKRSTACRLVLMGTVPLALAACSSKPKLSEGEYKTVDACVADGNPQAECQRAFDQAQASETGAAPRYNSYDECVRDYDADHCRPYTDATGHSFFGPFMTGFLISRLLQNDRYVYMSSQPLYRRRDGQDYQPYVYGGGGYYGGGASGGGWRSGGVRPGYSGWSSDAGSHAITASRGGFGSASAARGGWGS